MTQIPGGGQNTVGKDITDNANLSTCANPACTHEFKRMSEGKLFVRPAKTDENGLTQKALWLCHACADLWDLRYDRRKREYHLVRRRRIA
jgi:hypothetical protein